MAITLRCATLEVRNTYKELVPPEWVRKQTLAQAERYITQELKEYEEKILGAEDKILSLEAKLFNDLVMAMQEFIPQIQINANIVARLDCLLSFAKVAEENKYIRPVIDSSEVIDIKQGRHPVILLSNRSCLLANIMCQMIYCSTMNASRLSSSLVLIWLVNRLCCAKQL